MKSFTVGNIVSAGLRIYRDRFLEYFRIAFIGRLWVSSLFLIAGLCFFQIFYQNTPFDLISIAIRFLGILVFIYGLAQFSAINGLLGRMAFTEVTGKPENKKQAYSYIKKRFWQFIVADILVNLMVLVSSLFFYIILFIALFLLLLIIGVDFSVESPGSESLILIGILAIFGIILLILAITWVISRYLFTELPLATEDGMTALKTLRRSWNLTKGSVLRIQTIIFISFLICFPILFLFQIIIGTLQENIKSVFVEDSQFIGFTFLIGWFFDSLFHPLWQSIKAVIYYDLRVRREGLGIELEKDN